MKYLSLIVLSFFLFLKAVCQEFFIIKIHGIIYHNNVQLTEGSKITDLTNLTATSKTAALRVLIPGKGSYPISFEAGQRVAIKDRNNHSELYELSVQEYINKFSSFKASMKTKGLTHFDWINYFYDFSKDSIERKMLIIQSQKIPTESNIFKKTGYKLYACTYTENNDSIEKNLPIINDSIVFNMSSFPIQYDFKWRIKMDTADNGAMINVSDEQILSNILTIDELRGIINFFKNGFENNYKNAEEAKSDFYDYLQFNYGKFYLPFIEKYANDSFDLSTK